MAPPKGKDDKKKTPHQGPVIKDSRFSHVHRDPRFMRPTKKDSKVTVDSRFSGMLKGKEFSTAPKVDKYGRKLQGKAGDQQMKRFYQLQKGQTGSDDEENEEESEDDEEDKDEDEEDVSGSEDDEEVSGSEDDDENVYDPMRGRGVISGSDSDESDIDEEAAAELDREAEEGAEDEEEEESDDDVPRGDESHRFACVNLDWDHVKSTDLFKVFSGFKPEKGAIRSVRIYPSEFGKERLEREEREGPPPELFKKPGSKIKLDEDASDDEEEDEVTQETLIKDQTDDGDDHIDQEALRKYQLDRLKYYYAVVDCDSVETAKAICETCDGAEYESSANFFDLRFIPDGMEFDDAPRDEAFGAPENYKPSEFSTQVFQHSNVKLTWDEDDADRIKVTRHKFSKEDLEDMDFKAYLASSDEEDSEDEDDIEATRRKYRALLAGGGKDSDDSDADSDDDKNQEMEITFAPGLSEKAAELLEEKKMREEPVKEETSIETYRRKEKERKQRRKDVRAAKFKGSESEGDSDEEMGGGALFSDDEDDRLVNDVYFAEEFAGGDMVLPSKGKKGAAAGADKKKKNKSDKKKRTKEERLEDNRKKAELELLMEDNRESNQHFNMKQIQRAEKNEKKNKKNKKNIKDKSEDLQDDFKIDVQDPRFSALHESHHFALDPTNPNFKKTKAMTELMQERQRRTAGQGEEILEQTPDQKQNKHQKKKQNKNNNSANTNTNNNNSNSNNNKNSGGVKKATGLFEDPSLSLLVDTVKRKSAMATESSRDGKRAKKN
ncbi:pre-rRNA-processing protein esf1 [Gryganskiella cystojenkinii]|nr:pre-rRNA-processing protein esf1 [Gryganskiella cystojenkinii]